MRFYFLFAFIWLLGSIEVLAQSPSEKAWDFYEEISMLAHSPRPLPCETLLLDSLDRQLFAEGQAQMQLPAKGRWQILFEYRYEWEHIVGESLSSNNLKTILREAIPTVPIHCQYAPAYQYRSKELIEGLQLAATQSDFLNGPFSSFPNIHKRDDPLNGVWTSICSDNFLILRYVASYPDGNMTSFYKEIRLYFRRVR
jgi:hypothetical protein